MSPVAKDEHDILIVDDTLASLHLLARILKGAGYRVRLATDGELALRSVQAKPPALVLLDIRMSGLNGYEVCKRLKKDDRSRNIPVIFVSVADNEQDKVMGFAAGAVDYVNKPFHSEEVLARVNTHLSLRRAQLDVELRNAELENARRTLEDRVRERSAELEKTNQELREISRHKDEFLAALGHELRNPLSPIRNAGYILKLAGASNPRIMRAQQMIERQSLLLSRIVDELLDTARLTQGKLTLKKETLDWSELVRASVKDMQAEAERKEIELLIRSENNPLWVFADPIRLTQVAWNLVGNALKFTDPGGKVSVLMRSNDKGSAVLSVRDTGAGMNQATRSQLFKPFVIGEENYQRYKGGLGLGLALAKGFVELHGGTLEGTSKGPGQGSTFTVHMPLVRAVSAHAASEIVPKNEQHPAFRVLVVEDNVDAAESLREFLEMVGYTVDLALDGVGGVKKAKAANPSVVLCDIGLPGDMNGYDVAREISSDPTLNSTYLIALTGYGQDNDKRRAEQAGFKQHLTKPVDPNVLNKTLVEIGARP